VDDVQRHPVELDPELGERIDLGLLRAPVELLRPVAHHFLEPAALDAELPRLVAEVVGPTSRAQPPPQVVDLRRGNLDAKRRDAHGRFLPCHLATLRLRS
jgi:hypothetical protein